MATRRPAEPNTEVWAVRLLLDEGYRVRAFLARGGRPFSWVNPPAADRTIPGVTHATFTNSSMGIPVGYNIWLFRLSCGM